MTQKTMPTEVPVSAFLATLDALDLEVLRELVRLSWTVTEDTAV